MKPYRKNVGIVVFNRKGEVLTGERLSFPGHWQFPQGGIDEGEEPKLAAERELYEEVGVKGGEIVYEHPEWIQYDFPPELNIASLKKYSGQTQKWFLYFWDHGIEETNLFIHEQEFSALRFQELEATIDTIIDFKKDVYRKVISSFRPEIDKYLRSL